MSQFKSAVEARAVNEFWRSRTRRKLVARPERIGQALVALFLEGTIATAGSGIVLREISSGIGFVDIGVLFSSTLHLIELKILIKNVKGPSQLDAYMKSERRPEGWLVLFDARDNPRQRKIPSIIHVSSGVIRTMCIDINPVPPSRR